MKQSTTIKRLYAGLLSVAVLTGSSFALGEPVAALPGDEPAMEETVSQADTSVMVYGRLTKEGESLLLTNSNEEDPYQTVMVHVSPETMILDAVTGMPLTFDALMDGDMIYAYVAPAMTMSIPAQTTAEVILAAIPADFAVPSYVEVDAVERDDEGNVTVMTDDLILHLTSETEVFPYLTRNIVTTADIVPGSTLLAWYSTLATSEPAQASPDRVMLFPYSYEAYVDLSEEGITVNGETLTLTEAAMPITIDGNLMLPLRAFAEALGCEVSWDQETMTVTVSQNGAVRYAFVPGVAEYTADGETRGLVSASYLEDGVTFLSATDLLHLHNVKLG